MRSNKHCLILLSTALVRLQARLWVSTHKQCPPRSMSYITGCISTTAWAQTNLTLSYSRTILLGVKRAILVWSSSFPIIVRTIPLISAVSLTSTGGLKYLSHRETADAIASSEHPRALGRRRLLPYFLFLFLMEKFLQLRQNRGGA